MSARLLPALLLVLATCWLSPASAWGQTPIDLSLIQDVARAKAEEGLALFAAKKWTEAHEKFRLAEELFHAPTLGLHMAHCKRHLGELLAARALYRSVAAEALDDDAPPAFRTAIEEARTHAKEVDAEIPRLTLTVTGAEAERARVTVDGALLTVLTDVALDPGDHHIDVTAPGVVADARDIRLEPGTHERVAIELVRVAVVPVPVPSQPVEQPGSLVPGIIALGVGAAGLVVGIVAGAVALSRVDAIKAECDDDLCPDRLLTDADQAQLASTVSNVGFVVAGVGAIVGTILVIVRPGGGDMSVAVRPTGIAVEVRF